MTGDSSLKGPVTRKVFPFDDVIMVISYMVISYLVTHPYDMVMLLLSHTGDFSNFFV